MAVGKRGIVKRMFGKLGVACAAIVAVVGLSAPSSATATSADQPESLPETIMSGTVLDQSGNVSGTPVRLYIGESVAGQITYGTGGVAASAAAAVVNTDARGRFRLDHASLDRGELPTRSGRYDALIIAGRIGESISVLQTTLVFDAKALRLSVAPELMQDSSDVDSLAVTDVVTEGTAVPSAPPEFIVAQPSPASSLLLSGGGAIPEVTLRLSAAPRPGTAQQDGRSISPIGAEALASSGITVTRVKTYNGVLGYVGSIHASTNGYKATFSKTNSATASLGTAVKVGSSWSASGSISRSMGATTTWGSRTTAGNWVLGTYFTLAQYKNVVCDMGVCSTFYNIKPISHEGGAVSGTASRPTANYCRPYEKNSSQTLDRNAATLWSSGLKIGSIVGFDVTSQAGYSKNEKLRVEATASAGRDFCGTNRYPAQYPSRIVVKPKS